MKILITGANGYLGQGVVKALLDNGHSVVAADFKTTYVDERAEKIDCDLFSVEDPYTYFGKPDVLLHLAWRDGFVHYSENHIADLPKHYHFLKQMVDAGIEDGDKAESNSIGNQRELIRDFAAERPGLHLVEEYADDGYTGTNFERPGFKRMMEDITSGNHGKGSSTAMNRIVFCLHNCFMRNMNYTHAVWEGRNGCVNLFTCCEMKQCLKNNARTHKKSIKIWGIYENTIDNFPILCYI